jgi:hypothetical protein
MHLQQTKVASIKSGGPQYYLHDLSEHIKLYLRTKGVVPVALVTPYGATKSQYFAVGKDHKLGEGGKADVGKVGHDRIQGGGAESIGESIRKWFQLGSGNFWRIDVDIEVRDNVFYVKPLNFKYSEGSKAKEIVRWPHPLTFTHQHQSELWKQQIAYAEKQRAGIVKWSLAEICRIVKDHQKASKVTHVQEPDLLRAAGPLHVLGVEVGPYLGTGYDCETEFEFLKFPAYCVPLEIKRNSSGFKYQQKKYGADQLSRAVVLCAVHDHKTMPEHIDVIELRALCDYADKFLAA